MLFWYGRIGQFADVVSVKKFGGKTDGKHCICVVGV